MSGIYAIDSSPLSSTFCQEWPSSSPRPAKSDGATHTDIIYFIAVCQKLNVDFLPITWQSVLMGLGQGGQATVRQSHLGLETSFAFRQFRSHPMGTSEEQRIRAYRMFIREVSILKHPNFTDNPFIIDLLGVTWDYATADIWPVLVFPKSKYGDFDRFMASEEGKGLKLEHRLALWQDVAVSVSYIHASSEIFLSFQLSLNKSFQHPVLPYV
jgi:hypothetical protein